MLRSAILALGSSAFLVAADNWAVIVAGSRSYYNYRHQADACHAYQIVSKAGIPDDKIIMMYVDDVADARDNPYPGKLFNKPTALGVPGVDVYAGCKKDYTGESVNSKNFLAVLTGDKVGSKGMPVLESTSEDNVFVNFVDHGGVGVIAFGGEDLLSSQDLNAALRTAHTKGLYKKMVFYLEACESGSMFQDQLPQNLSIYATTAANGQESSWGTYCPPDDTVNGKVMDTCLGDLYSVNWMENAMQAGMKETLATQFNVVKQETNKSHVQEFGNESFTSDPIGDFLGSNGAPDVKAPCTDTSSTAATSPGLVSSRDIPMHLAYYKYLRSTEKSMAERMAHGMELMKVVQRRLEIDNLFLTLARTVAGDTGTRLLSDAPTPEEVATECVSTLRQAYESGCGGFDDYSLQYYRTLVNICGYVRQNAKRAQQIASTLRSLCTKQANI